MASPTNRVRGRARAGAALVAALASGWAGAALAAGEPGALRGMRIAVLEFEAPWRVRCDALRSAGRHAELERDNRCKALEILSDAARTAASDPASRAGMTLFTRANTVEILREQGICNVEDGDCALETGRRLGVHFLMVGKVSELEGLYIVDLQLYDVATGAVLPGASQVEGKGLVDASRSVRMLVPRVIERGLRIPSSEVRQPAAAVPGGVPSGAVGDSPAAGTGGLLVRSEPAGAPCKVDGHDAGETPCRVEALPAGRHLIAVHHPHAEPYQEVVTVEAGQVLTREIRLAMLPVQITFRIDPAGATVQLDGGTADVTRPLPLPPGAHRLSVGKAGYITRELPFEVRPGQPGTVSVALSAQPIPTTVTVQPAEATVRVDGGAAAPGRPVPLAPGRHRVEASRDGYLPQVHQLELGIGQKEAKLDVRLVRMPLLAVSTTPPGALVRLDGRDRGRTELALTLEPGHFELELELAGFENVARSLDLRPGQEERLGIALTRGFSRPERQTRATMRGWAWGLSAAAAAGLAVFAWQGLEARSLDAKAGDLLAGTAAARSNAADQKRAMRVADSGLVLGVLSAVPAGILWWKLEF